MSTFKDEMQADVAKMNALPNLTHLRVVNECTSCRATGLWEHGFRLGTCEDCGLEVCHECGNPEDDFDGTTFWCDECNDKVDAG